MGGNANHFISPFINLASIDLSFRILNCLQIDSTITNLESHNLHPDASSQNSDCSINICVMVVYENFLKIVVEREYPYHFFRANQRKVNSKIYSLTDCDLIVNGCDWHILAKRELYYIRTELLKYKKNCHNTQLLQKYLWTSQNLLNFQQGDL